MAWTNCAWHTWASDICLHRYIPCKYACVHACTSACVCRCDGYARTLWMWRKTSRLSCIKLKSSSAPTRHPTHMPHTRRTHMLVANVYTPVYRTDASGIGIVGLPILVARRNGRSDFRWRLAFADIAVRQSNIGSCRRRLRLQRWRRRRPGGGSGGDCYIHMYE